MNTPVVPTRSRRTRRPLALLAAAALVLPLTSGCTDGPVPVRTADPTPPSITAPVPAPRSPGPTGSSTPSSTTAPEGPTVVDGASWSFPTSPDGWTLEVADVDGVFRISNPDGCRYSSGQDVFQPSGFGDRVESEYQAAAVMAHYQTTTDSASSAMSDSTTVTDTAGNPVEMVRVDTTYTGADGTGYQVRTWLRVFTSQATPTFLSLSYTCPADAFDETELSTLLEHTSISNPGPADMDDSAAAPSGGSTEGTEDDPDGSQADA